MSVAIAMLPWAPMISFAANMAMKCSVMIPMLSILLSRCHVPNVLTNCPQMPISATNAALQFPNLETNLGPRAEWHYNNAPIVSRHCPSTNHTATSVQDPHDLLFHEPRVTPNVHAHLPNPPLCPMLHSVELVAMCSPNQLHVLNTHGPMGMTPVTVLRLILPVNPMPLSPAPNHVCALHASTRC